MRGKKKILYVITKSNWGGAQRYVYDLATNLPEGRFEPVVVAGGTGTLNAKLLEKHIRVISIERLERNIHLFDDIAVFAALVKLFLREKPDIIHLNSSKIGGIGALAGRITRVPRIIFTAHGWAFNEPRNPVAKRLIRFLSWITVLLSHHTITVSKHDKRSAGAMPFIAEKISCVYNGISDKNPMTREEARALLLGGHHIKPSKETVWIGTVGELTGNKGLPYAIKACAQLKTENSFHFVYIIVGDGSDKYKLANLIKTYELEEQVALVGFKKEAASLIPAFDMFLLPSVKEGLPYVLLAYPLTEQV